MSPEIWNTLSIIANLVFGGGLLVTLTTLKSQRRKAAAEVDTVTIGNTKEIVELWREWGETQAAEYKAQIAMINERFEAIIKSKEEIEQKKSKQIEDLTKAVAKLNQSQKMILEMLNKISHDNLEQIVADIKKEVKKDV